MKAKFRNALKTFQKWYLGGKKKQKLKDGADKLTNKMSTPMRTTIYAAKQQKNKLENLL